MYRNKVENFENVNFLFNNGGLGDVIAAAPVFSYVYKNHPQVRAHIWVPDYLFDFYRRSLPADSSRMVIRLFSQNEKKYNKNYKARAYSLQNQHHTNLATHLTRFAFNTFINVEVPTSEFSYLKVRTDDVDVSRFNLPEKYVTIAVGFTSNTREFLPKHVNDIITYLNKKGYTPVFLGKKEAFSGYKHTIKGSFNEEINYSLGIDLVDKTSLIEAQKIIAGSSCLVGLDSGLIHVGATSDVPIVCGYTSMEPEHRIPYRNGVFGWNFHAVSLSKKELSCSGCQSNLTFAFGHSFMDCYYKDYACLSLLSANKYIEKLEKIL